MTNRKKSKWFALGLAVLAILMLLVNLCFYGACDELYFTAWEFSSLQNLILSRPELKGSYVVGVMHNGRIMGNLIGVAQAKLLFSSVGWLRGVLFTGIMLILAYLIMRAAGKRNGLRFLASMALLIFAPKTIYADVYSWGVSFVNYLIPLTCFLLCFCLLHRERKLRGIGTIFLFLLAFQSQLYAESVTVSFCAYALLLLFDRDLQKGPRVAAAAGFLLGALAMFLNPEYQAVKDNTRAIIFELPKLYERSVKLFQTVLMSDWPLMALFSWVLAGRLFGKSAGRTVTAICNILLGLGLTVLRFLLEKGTALPEPVLLTLGILTLALHTCSLLRLPDAGRKKAAFSLYAVASISLLALIPVNHVYTPRLLAEGYYLIGATLVFLLPDRLPAERLIRCGLVVLSVLWLGNLLYIYGQNSRVNRERIALGRELVKQGAETITLPLVPYPDYVVNETKKKGDLGFLIYREVPLDQKLVCIPYAKWIEQEEPASTTRTATETPESATEQETQKAQRSYAEMTDAELVEAVADYRHLIDIYAAPDLAAGLEALKTQCGAYAELTTRENWQACFERYGTELIEAYKQTPREDGRTEFVSQTLQELIDFVNGRTHTEPAPGSDGGSAK